MIRFGIALALLVLLGLGAHPALKLPRIVRLAPLLPLEAAVFLSPLLILPHARFARFVVAAIAIMIAAKVWDLYLGAGIGERPSLALWAANLLNPTAIVLRKVAREPRPRLSADVIQLVAGAIGGAVSIVLLIRIFRLDWRAYPFAVEHCVKVVGLFVAIAFVPNAVAAAYRLAGLPVSNFSGNFFLARTPAEFWRRYNRPAAQFFQEDIFKPWGGRRRPLAGTLLTFAVSGLLHEYLFDIAAGRGFGLQMTFFLIQGIAALATARVHPAGWAAAVAVALTFAFNLAAALLFFASVNQVVPFYVHR